MKQIKHILLQESPHISCPFHWHNLKRASVSHRQALLGEQKILGCLVWTRFQGLVALAHSTSKILLCEFKIIVKVNLYLNSWKFILCKCWIYTGTWCKINLYFKWHPSHTVNSIDQVSQLEKLLLREICSFSRTESTQIPWLNARVDGRDKQNQVGNKRLGYSGTKITKHWFGMNR